MINVMLDLETMGNGLRPAILQIAAVAFDEEFNEIESFNKHVSLLSSVMAGLEIKKSTVEFWRDQNEDAQKKIYNGQCESIPLYQALDEFSYFIKQLRRIHGDVLLWGNGSISDNVWMMSAYDAVGMDFNKVIGYNEHACFRQEMRNCVKEFDVNPRWALRFIGVEHDAMDDCRHQIRSLKTYALLRDLSVTDLDEAIENISEYV